MKKNLLIVFPLLLSISLYAQTKIVTIRSSKGEMITGANVSIPGTINSTTTDNEGRFSLEISLDKHKQAVSLTGVSFQIAPSFLDKNLRVY